MLTFKPWDVVKVPFPYLDRPVRQYRPGLVVAAGPPLAAHGLLWVLMITSAENRRWDGDVVISDLTKTGLPAPSLVRCAKVATIESREAKRVGTLPEDNRSEVDANLTRAIAAVAGRAASGDAKRR
ncbi:MAG: type II toxin-antitoxin system PemK/MazF family toxin [Alphaproteobacteria bacterium]|nr:type II toxin-antitoxin system PemK/MazF family toxin [Alphaproteobacteria bacterium]